MLGGKLQDLTLIVFKLVRGDFSLWLEHFEIELCRKNVFNIIFLPAKADYFLQKVSGAAFYSTIGNVRFDRDMRRRVKK